jgi:hypothetical protein
VHLAVELEARGSLDDDVDLLLAPVRVPERDAEPGRDAEEAEAGLLALESMPAK